MAPAEGWRKMEPKKIWGFGEGFFAADLGSGIRRRRLRTAAAESKDSDDACGNIEPWRWRSV